MKAATLEIYTDGSCEPNPGQGGWAFFIPSLGIERSGSEADTTNNRMEAQAILEACLYMDAKTHAVIYTDSQLCINTATGKWKAKKNKDLVSKIKQQLGSKRIVFRWVRGHNGNPHNERADYLAGLARRNGLTPHSERYTNDIHEQTNTGRAA